jgi:hypothetical protein
MKRFLIVCAAIVTGVGTIAQAQLTNNPYVPNTTNTTVLTPIGPYGFGVALIGYPMPNPGSTNKLGVDFFANNSDGAALSDASTAPESGMVQFYAGNLDNSTAAKNINSWPSSHLVGFRVLQPTSNPNQMTVYKSWVGSIQTNFLSCAAPDLQNGGACAGGFGIGGISKDGTMAARMDGGSAPCSPSMPGVVDIIIPSQVANTIIVTNGIENNTLTLTIDAGNKNVPQIGSNAKLIADTAFSGYAFVARSDINPGNTGSLSYSSNGQYTVLAGFNNTGTFNSRGSMAHNDTAKIMACFVKTAADLTATRDAETGLAVLKYTDAGGPITVTSYTTNVFGLPTTADGLITTNGQHFFSRSQFVGPAQISINDSGAVAFAVSINCQNYNGVPMTAATTNGTRFPQVSGIIYRPPNTNAFLFVTDNTDTNLFWVPPGNCTNKNLISSVALDNYNNVYFMASYANNTNFPCDFTPSNAVYQAVANNPTNPTSWSVRILLRQRDTFTNTVSGDIFTVYSLPYEQSPNSPAIASHSMGPNAINRTQLPGHTLANTAPSDPFAVGGILVQAFLSNRTTAVTTDGLLYIAPFSTSTCPSLPFVITSVTRSGNNISVTYNAQPGTNTVESTAGGNYTGSGFTVLTTSTNIVTGCAASATFTDVGGGSGNSNNYYRVRNSPP